MFRLGILCLAMLASGCLQASRARLNAPEPSPADLVFLTREGCATTRVMRANLDAALSALGLPAQYAFVDLESVGPDDPRAGYGTPTVLYRNHDLFGMPTPASGQPGAT